MSAVPFAAFASFLSGLGETEVHPLNLFVCIADGLASYAGRRPLAVVIDDAHLLDEGSAALVHQLATTGRARFITTIRSGERSVAAMTRLWQDGHARRVVLKPFDLLGVREVLEAALGGPVDALTIARLRSWTGGNALFIRELVLEGRTTGRLRVSNQVWHRFGPVTVGESLRELVRSRFADLADSDLAAVRLVALGEPVETAVAATLVGPDVVDRLCQQGLLVEDVSGHPVLRLPHPLYAEALLADMGTAIARQLRLRLAVTLDTAGRSDGFTILRRVCLRLDGGEPLEDADLLSAAEHAVMLLDGALAERLARAAAGDSDRRVMVLARALTQQDRASHAENVLAEYLSGRSPDPPLAVILLRVENLNLAFKLGKPKKALALLDDAEAHRGQLPMIDAGRISPSSLPRRRFRRGGRVRK
jgi:hypothetical protein